jgi:hypothetical protein
MSTSYHAAILDHLAEFMLYLSTASSFWFSLNSAHDRSISLSDRLGMSQHDYERLLVTADLAKFQHTWGFQIKLMEWNNFIGGHQFTATTNLFEVACQGISAATLQRVCIHPFYRNTFDSGVFQGSGLPRPA